MAVSAGNISSNSLQNVCSGKILLFAEVKQLLSAVQLVIDTRKLQPFKTRDVDFHVSFTESDIRVQVDSLNLTLCLEKLRFNPASCNGLICLPNGELQLRMQVAGPNIGCQINAKQKFHHQRQLVEKFSKEYLHCACAMCGEKILRNDCKFTRILPLPSENWCEMADTWFCHRHDDGTSMPNTLLPRQSDCLVGELYFLIHKSSAKVNKHLVSEDSCIQCHRCRNPLGELFKGRQLSKDHKEKMIYPDIFKIFFHSVSFFCETAKASCKNQGLSKPESLELKGEDFIARYFLEQCKTYTSYRFLVQPQITAEKKKTCCLLWLLDGDALMYKKEVKIRSKVMSEVTEVKQTIAVKVLYRAYFQSKQSLDKLQEISDKGWREDRSVHQIDLPDTLYFTLITALLRNTRQLPSSLRYLNGFHVGYLTKLPVSVT